MSEKFSTELWSGCTQHPSATLTIKAEKNQQKNISFHEHKTNLLSNPKLKLRSIQIRLFLCSVSMFNKDANYFNRMLRTISSLI